METDHRVEAVEAEEDRDEGCADGEEHLQIPSCEGQRSSHRAELETHSISIKSRRPLRVHSANRLLVPVVCWRLDWWNLVYVS